MRHMAQRGLSQQVSKYYNDNKQLLDEAFVISGIIKVEVSVISLSLRLRLTKTSHFLTLLSVNLTLLLEIMHCARKLRVNH